MRQFAFNLADIVTLLVFVVLGANIPFGDLADNLLPALAVLAALLFVARPLTVLACALPDRRGGWTWPEIAFLCWTRETGVVPAALVGVLVGLGVPNGELYASVVALAIDRRRCCCRRCRRRGWPGGWGCSTESEQLQVAIDFPLSDLVVPLGELSPASSARSSRRSPRDRSSRGPRAGRRRARARASRRAGSRAAARRRARAAARRSGRAGSARSSARPGRARARCRRARLPAPRPRPGRGCTTVHRAILDPPRGLARAASACGCCSRSSRTPAPSSTRSRDPTTSRLYDVTVGAVIAMYAFACAFSPPMKLYASSERPSRAGRRPGRARTRSRRRATGSCGSGSRCRSGARTAWA